MVQKGSFGNTFHKLANTGFIKNTIGSYSLGNPSLNPGPDLPPRRQSSHHHRWWPEKKV